jgi:hypothetical protein
VREKKMTVTLHIFMCASGNDAVSRLFFFSSDGHFHQQTNE